MFEDEEFKRDMNTEAGQRAQLTSNTNKAATQAYDSDDSDIEQMTK